MSVRFKADEIIIYSGQDDRTSDVIQNTTDSENAGDVVKNTASNIGMKEEENDEKSMSDEEEEEEEEYSSNDEDQLKEGIDGGGDDDTKKCTALSGPLNGLGVSSSSLASSRSVIEWDDDDNNDPGFSQDPRSFLSRMLWNETDVRFHNRTNREVMFVIADEEFTLKRTSKVSASASLNDDDDDDDDDKNNGFDFPDLLAGLMPISGNANISQSKISTQSALKTRCMPLAPYSDSSQHFQEERLTYVTALTKDVDGDNMPWSRVHYENKVINCKRTKSLKFFNKHLKVVAYRICQPPQSSSPPPSQVSPMTSPIRDLSQITSSSRTTSSTKGQKKRLMIAEKQKLRKQIKL